MPLPGDVEGRAVGDARPDDRQAERDVDGAVEADRLERDVPLVVVHRDDGVELAARARAKSVSAAIGPVDVDALGLRCGRRPGR